MHLQPLQHIKLLAFDADDTLWDCQGYFEAVEKAYCKLLSSYGSFDEISNRLFSVESANIALMGYGSKAFTLSMIENAIRVPQARFTKPLTVKVDANQLHITADIKVKYGANVAATCELVQNKIYENIVFMTGFKPADVTVNVIDFEI